MMTSTTPAGESLRPVQNIPLTNVEGRIDHLSVDLKGQRLFVAALGNNSVEILDLHTGKLIRSISGFSEPQGVLYIPEIDRLYVSNGGTGVVDVLDGTSFAEVARVSLSGDADNLRSDSANRTVVAGYGDGGLGFIDTGNAKIAKEIQLGGHPESFQMEVSGSKIFVNIPTRDQIAVVDTGSGKVATSWLMTHGIANYPMALDEMRHRLFVGFRLPAKLGVFDAETGNLITSFDSAGDADDIFYDSVHKLVFVIGGGGAIDLFSQKDADHYQLLRQIPTAPGTRTGLWVPEWNRLYVAVPHQGVQEAEIQVYELQP